MLTEIECKSALDSMKNGKSPGTDGLTPEFYKFFWTEIKELVLDALNYAFNTGKLSIDQRRGIISLIPKKDKQRTLLKNWRPISLLNTDYKLLSKSMARRMQSFLPKLIHGDQTGYIKNRFIGENIRVIDDVLRLTEIQNIPGLILLVDFEKAFDTIEWPYIKKVLDAFNFGEDFQRWISVLFNNPSCCVINNGYASEFFTLSRGVRQGCPASPFLFILAVELLAISIRSNANIKGITLGEEEIKISQLADDTTCFLSDIESARQLLRVLQNFEIFSGLKCNKDKTIARWIGASKFSPDGDIPVLWCKDHFTVLGVTFHEDEKHMVKLNFDPKITSFKEVLKVWNARNLSLIGKNIVLKSLAISKLLFCAHSFILIKL